MKKNVIKIHALLQALHILSLILMFKKVEITLNNLAKEDLVSGLAKLLNIITNLIDNKGNLSFHLYTNPPHQNKSLK